MTAAPAPTASAAPAVFRPGRIARAIAFFSGSAGLTVKIVLLAITNALALWAAIVLLDKHRWVSLAVVVAATAAIDYIYVAPVSGTLPAKFLVPGTIFLLGFQIVPIIYTIEVAFSNYSTGHISSKADAIRAVELNSLQPPPNGRQFEMSPAHDSSGNLVMILHDDASGKVYVGTKKELKPLSQSDVKLDDTGTPTAAEGYKLVAGAELFALDRALQGYTIPTKGAAAIAPQGIHQAVELEPTLRYDKRRNAFVRISDGAVFRDNGRGSFVSPKGDELEPGWKTYIGFHNFGKLATNPLYRTPFIRVFIWTFAYAALTVFVSFFVGLFLAIALDKPGLRLQRTYRSILIIPYALPAFLSILIWGGMLNDDFGIVNHLFHIHVPWLFDSNWARVSVVLVSVWLTTPYFFLVSLGALQSIPAELTEAARVDGGGGWAIFRRVTLPLLLVAVTPLLIASFAFNFNNFGAIYLLTGGGPYNGASSVAGATDILITYTYKLAIASGKGQDYALASAVAIVIFFVVASISGFTFWRSKTLETVS